MYHKRRCQHLKMKLKDSISISNEVPMNEKIYLPPHPQIQNCQQQKTILHHFPSQKLKNEITELSPVSKHIKEFDFSFDKKMSAVDDPSARGQNKIHRHAYIYFPKTNFNQNILVNFHLVTCKLSSIVHTIFSLCHLIVS